MQDGDEVMVSSTNEEESLELLLTKQAEKVIDFFSTCTLTVDRTSKESLWLTTVAFYKRSLACPEKLKRELCIQFNNEAGADSGALRREFFEEAILQANSHLLEGEDENRVMKKDWGMESMYEVMGCLVAHSILQNGPAMPCFSLATYDFLTGRNCYPEMGDIPLTLGTHQLISLISKVYYYYYY